MPMDGTMVTLGEDKRRGIWCCYDRFTGCFTVYWTFDAFLGFHVLDGCDDCDVRNYVLFDANMEYTFLLPVNKLS